jgi:hypothetical protein
MQFSNLQGLSVNRVSSTTIKNRQKFLEWLKKKQPQVYAAAMRRAGLGVMSADTNPVASPSIWDSIVGGIKDVLPTIVQARAQQKIFDAQMKRATQGLPPLQTAEYAPTVRVQAGVSPGITDTLKQMAIPLAVAGAGFLFFMMKKKR